MIDQDLDKPDVIHDAQIRQFTLHVREESEYFSILLYDSTLP